MKKSLLLSQLLPLLLGLFLVFGNITETNAQDIHFSQFYHSPQNINPSLTGVFNGHQRFIGNYRSQWNSVPVSYMTFSGAYDMKFYHPGMTNSVFGAGAVFNYDQAGDSKLNLTSLGLSGSYTHRLTEKNFLSIGLLFNFAQRAFDPSGLTFNTQFNGDVFISDLPTQEEDKFKNDNIFFADFNVGLNYRYQAPKKRTRLNVGASLFHINQPVVSFYGNEQKRLPNRLNFFGTFDYQLTRKIDLLLRGMAQFQNAATENVVGLAGKFYLDKDKNYNDMAFSLGLSYRFFEFGDAIIPNIELNYGPWQAGLSYDINISNFKTATNGRGGLELAVIYTIFKVHPLGDFRNCIIF